MVARFSRFLTLTGVAALVIVSCTRETPLQPLRPDVIAQDTTPPDTLAPSNDDIANARFTYPLPYEDTVDISHATVEQGEPSSSCDASAGPASRSVWYFTTSNLSAPMTAQLLGGDSAIVVAVYAVSYDSTGPVLTEVGCSFFGGSVTFAADSGTSFYFQVYDYQDLGSRTLFRLDQRGGPTGPPNDNFDNATIAPGVPYSSNVDMTTATNEPGEPVPYCGLYPNTVWYQFTPGETRGLQTGFRFTSTFSIIAVYTGSSLYNLSLLTCGYSYSNLTFTARAGTTYYVQISNYGGSGQFFLEPPPPPQANFFMSPSDPSSFDFTQFYDQSYDPGGVGIETWLWDFGDGSSGSGYSVSHRYAVDGDYAVVHAVTTYDGRTASVSRTIQVRTRDVAITRFSTPSSGMSGKTAKLSVDIRSNRYPETVQVQLFKSVPGGYQSVATSIQTLPTRNRVTSVAFSYTFTSQDAAVGKVTFRALVNILSGRDALPADNEAIGPPTKVTR
jgi:hypothetical protein